MLLVYDKTVSLRFQDYFTHIINLNDQLRIVQLVAFYILHF